METQHTRLKLDPINITIHKQAKNTWEKLKDTDRELYNSLVRDYSHRIQTHYFPSSRIIAEGRDPRPIYTIKDRPASITTSPESDSDE